jgi:hypothetical protein
LRIHSQARAENLERYRIIAEEEEERRLEQEQAEANARRAEANAKKAELRALQEANMERWKAKESFRELNGDYDDDEHGSSSPKQSKSEAARAKVCARCLLCSENSFYLDVLSSFERSCVGLKYHFPLHIRSTFKRRPSSILCQSYMYLILLHLHHNQAAKDKQAKANAAAAKREEQARQKREKAEAAAAAKESKTSAPKDSKKDSKKSEASSPEASTGNKRRGSVRRTSVIELKRESKRLIL